MPGKATPTRSRPTRSRAAPPKAAPPRRPQGRPQKQEPAITREGLVAVARGLLQTTAPAALTRAAIARAAGVDPGLIRYYFGDTAALLAAATEAAARELRQRQRALAAQGAAQGRGVEDNLRERIRVLVETLFEAPYLHRLLLEQIVYGRSEAVRGVRDDLVHGALREWEALLAEGVAQGRMRRVDVRHLLLAVIGMCSFPMTERPLFQELTGAPVTREAARAYAESVAALVLDGLRPAS